MVLSYRLESAACTICCLNNRQNSASRICLVSIYRLEQRLVQFAKLNNRQIQRETINIKIVKNSDCRCPAQKNRETINRKIAKKDNWPAPSSIQRGLEWTQLLKPLFFVLCLIVCLSANFLIFPSFILLFLYSTVQKSAVQYSYFFIKLSTPSIIHRG